ncbi:hypothetical protein P8C59_001563 [Phyllachora maydis]|uniref:FHA domain-containing protein n=1 Tax=Phyllachora maydis TaxID=1825666 RepID=A0AAD9HYQ3_9PEZI|nr:hypothetical protein P8C59_001563 [Phyllachora maydis]
MWLLEEKEARFLQGRRLWLRPGRRYIVGRTGTVPITDSLPAAQHIVLLNSHVPHNNTISRSHLLVCVDAVPEGDALNVRSRSRVTIEDLKTKKGSILNGKPIRGEKHQLTEAHNDLSVGNCGADFRLTWHPVVLTFSFTAKEARADPWAKLRESLEQLDIKFSSHYEQQLTSHVVAKKRNTSKGLQALINGRYVVTDSFINAIAAAAAAAAAVPGHLGPEEPSALETDFDAAWPRALEHLPPSGNEPSKKPAEAYAPDARRQDVFMGYTFVFYNQEQYDNLCVVVTGGKGKVHLCQVTPEETTVDDFVRDVKTVAGEKGLGSFEDGSEGRGVVVVRYLPSKGPHVEWYSSFFTDTARRLDHRPIEQSEFLEAILRFKGFDLDSDSDDDKTGPAAAAAPLHEPRATQGVGAAAAAAAAGPSQDSLFVSQNPHAAADPDPAPYSLARRSQRKRGPPSPAPEEEHALRILEEMAPGVAPAKRRRLRDAAVDPDDASVAGDGDGDVDMDAAASPEAVGPSTAKPPKGGGGKGGGRGKKAQAQTAGDDDADDILARVTRRRREEEARLAAEKKALEMPAEDGIDYAAIRQLHIVEECAVHFPAPEGRGKDNVGADGGRWDPAWNGRRNFKRFRRQGEAAGRAAAAPRRRIIIGLEEVKNKEFGIGDDYWLEDEPRSRQRGATSQTQTQAAKASRLPPPEAPRPRGRVREAVAPVGSSDAEEEEEQLLGPGDADEEERERQGGMYDGMASATLDFDPDDDDDDDDERIIIPGSRRRAGEAAKGVNARRGRSPGRRVSGGGDEAATATATATIQTRGAGKRAAVGPPMGAVEKAAKKARQGAGGGDGDGDGKGRGRAVVVRDSDDSDDGGMKFRFGRRK